MKWEYRLFSHIMIQRSWTQILIVEAHYFYDHHDILDLSYGVKLTYGELTPSVNNVIMKTAQGKSIDKLYCSLQRVSHIFTGARYDAQFFMVKYNMIDGFWRLDCAQGNEWNVWCLLSHPPESPIQLVVLVFLQVGWMESMLFFCTTSAIGHDMP